MKENKKSKRGISLIVLIITIIVIVILAVAVILSIANNNPIENAKEATKANNVATDKERINMSVLSSIGTNGEIDVTKINNELGTNIQKLPAIVKLDSGYYSISSKGEVNKGWGYKKAEDGKYRYISNGERDIEIGSYITYDPTHSDLEGNDEIFKEETSYAGSPTATGYYIAADQQLEKGNGYGDYTYNNTLITGGWKVLGVDEETGGILLISADLVKDKNGSNFGLRGIAGYIYGVEELNKVCSVFGYGYGANYSRSVKVEDINKVTGYNPKNTGVYDPEQIGDKTTKYYAYNSTYQYNNMVTYKCDPTAANKVLAYIGNSKKSEGTDSNYAKYGFNWFEGNSWNNLFLINVNEETINTTPQKSNYYLYYPNSLTTNDIGTNILDKVYVTVFGESNISYWLSSSYSVSYSSSINYGIRNVNNGVVRGNDLYTSKANSSSIKKNTRPVVSLKTDIELSEYNSEHDSYDIVK